MLLTMAGYGVASAVAPWLVGRWGRRAFAVLALVPALAFVDTVRVGALVHAGRPRVESVPWVPGLDLELAFRVDTLAWVMSLLVTGIGALVLFYCARYFAADEPGLGRFAGVLMAFAGAMHGLVVAADAERKGRRVRRKFTAAGARMIDQRLADWDEQDRRDLGNLLARFASELTDDHHTDRRGAS